MMLGKLMYREQIAVGSANETAVGPISDKVLIVIPCFNEREYIGKLVSGVQENTAGLDRLIVIADGGSTDGSQSILAEIAARDPCVKVIANPKRIQSAGVNLAVRAFGEGRRWLVRLDAHSGYPAGYIKTLIAEAYRTGAASVVVAMMSQGRGPFQSAVAAVQNSLLGAGGAPHRRSGNAEFVDHGHHALFDLERFVALGGYDESASHNEDAEFDIRLGRAGGKIWLTRSVEIIYFPRADAKALYRQYLCYGRGRAATLLRHRKMPKLRQLLPACIAPAAAGLLCAPWLAVACLPAVSWGALCLLFGAKLGMRLGLRGGVFAAAAAMTIHMAWSIGFWWELLSRIRHGSSAAFNAVATAGDTAS
jgi:succinoglycan biosynthesis protein ExoA